ncbi:MAG: FlgD immunoglobulin-like domain containing protein [bacterium]
MRKSVVMIVALLCVVSLGRSQQTKHTLYVVNGLGRTVSKMDLESGEIRNDFVTVGDIPNRIFTKGDKVYVVNSVPAGITVIDGTNGQIVNNITLTVGSNPWSMGFAGENKAYVTNLFANTVTVLDLASGDSVDTIPVGVAPEGVLVLGDRAYVTNTGGFPSYNPSTVSVVDTQADTVTKTISVATNPQELALAPDGKIHVVCTGNFGDITGKMYIIDPTGDADGTAAVVDSIIIGGAPADIAITPEGLAFLADFGDGINGFLYTYDAATKQVLHNASNPILVGGGAMNLLFDQESGSLYVNNFSDDTVQLLNPANGAVLNTFEFGDGALDMAILRLNTTSVDTDNMPAPADFSLFQNYPNPFNPETIIRFSVSKKARIQIKIYNLKGQLIRTLVNDRFETGDHSTTWNGRNDGGAFVASGLYFYEMQAGDFQQVKRLTLIR